LSQEQINQRLTWCLNNNDNSFDNYLFADETKVIINYCPIYHLRLKKKYPKAICITSNFRAKLNIWAGISKRGATNFVVNFKKV
jgi:hypothetical protein